MPAAAQTASSFIAKVATRWSYATIVKNYFVLSACLSTKVTEGSSLGAVSQGSGLISEANVFFCGTVASKALEIEKGIVV